MTVTIIRDQHPDLYQKICLLVQTEQNDKLQVSIQDDKLMLTALSSKMNIPKTEAKLQYIHESLAKAKEFIASQRLDPSQMSSTSKDAL